MKIWITFFVALLFFGFSLLANISPAQAAACAGTAQPSEGLLGIDILQLNRSIVPCGRNCNDGRTPYDEMQSCTLCHLLIMTKNIFDLMFAWLIIISLLMLTIGGVTYLVSVGNPGMATLGKGILTKTLTGFGGFLASWLLVYTLLVFLSAKPNDTIGINSGANWWQFTCDEASSPFDSAGTTGTGTGTGTGTTGTISAAEQAARDALSAQGISVWESSTGATNVVDLRATSTSGVIAFKNALGGPIIITGGAEADPVHTTGTYSHANGYKVDIEDTDAVNTFIMDNYTPIGTRSDGAAMYDDGFGNIYAKETTHWDVCYDCH